MTRFGNVAFGQAFVDVPVGVRKVPQSEYDPNGAICVVDQGQELVSGRTDRSELVIDDGPYIVFGDHTRVVKFVDFPFVAGADGVRLFKASENFDPEYLFLFLRSAHLPVDGYGRHSKYLKHLLVPSISRREQRRTAAHLKAQLAAVETARKAAQAQLAELSNLANAIVSESMKRTDCVPRTLGEVLEEIKQGIGAKWGQFPVLGATRAGLALAKEPVGKHPERYKPVVHGSVFYNPMRILIGSIAIVDDDDEPGITSPDYVVLRGRKGEVDSRWFYHWLRSPFGEHCIASLARGAVRERMLFNRLAQGSIELPSRPVQERASRALATIRPVKEEIEKQLADLEALPARLLAQAFDSTDKELSL